MRERGSSMSQWDNACHWQYHSRNASRGEAGAREEDRIHCEKEER